MLQNISITLVDPDTMTSTTYDSSSLVAAASDVATTDTAVAPATTTTETVAAPVETTTEAVAEPAATTTVAEPVAEVVA